MASIYRFDPPVGDRKYVYIKYRKDAEKIAVSNAKVKGVPVRLFCAGVCLCVAHPDGRIRDRRTMR